MTRLVSVLVPAFNHDKYIIECLNSILFQDYNKIELIIIDDGSHDSTPILISDWLEEHGSRFDSIYFEVRTNCGISSTLNYMLSHCKGDFVTICASDDVLVTNSISMRIDYINSNNNIDAILTDSYVIDENSRVIHESAIKSLCKIKYSYLLQNFNETVLLSWCVFGPNQFFKRSVFLKLKGYDQSLLVEDREFWLRLLAKFNCEFYPHRLAYYRIHGKNITKRLNIKRQLYVDIANSNIMHHILYYGFVRLYLLTYSVDKCLLKSDFLYKSIYPIFKKFRQLFIFIYFYANEIKQFFCSSSCGRSN